MPEVLHPAVEPPSAAALAAAQATWREVLDPSLAAFLTGKRVFLSINRFERKKARRAALS